MAQKTETISMHSVVENLRSINLSLIQSQIFEKQKIYNSKTLTNSDFERRKRKKG